MNENERQTSGGEAIVVLIFLFLVLAFFIFRYGKTSSTIKNSDSSTASETFLENTNTIKEDETFAKYLKQVYETNTGTSTKEIDSIVNDFQDELLKKVAIPEQNIILENVSSSANLNIYAKNFDQIFEDLKKRGGGSESTIFESQIAADGNLLPLSDFDKESLLRISEEYKIFANKLIALETPKQNEKIASEVALAALNVSFIINKMVTEQDKKVYSLWISKYSENMFVIITDRYALLQK